MPVQYKDYYETLGVPRTASRTDSLNWRIENGNVVDEQALKLYAEYRGRLEVRLQAAYDQFDKAILTLSGGALALSIGFIKDVVPLKQAAWKTPSAGIVAVASCTAKHSSAPGAGTAGENAEGVR